MDLLLEETDVPLDETTMLWCHRPIQLRCSGEVSFQITKNSKLIVPKQTTIWEPLRRYILYVKWRASHIYSLWCETTCVTIVSAVGGKEDMFIDKKQSIANSTSCWSLISSLGTLSHFGQSASHFFLWCSLSSWEWSDPKLLWGPWHPQVLHHNPAY